MRGGQSYPLAFTPFTFGEFVMLRRVFLLNLFEGFVMFRRVSLGALVLFLVCISSVSYAETWAQAVARCNANETAADNAYNFMHPKSVTASQSMSQADDVDRTGANWTACESQNYDANFAFGELEYQDASEEAGSAAVSYAAGQSKWLLAYSTYPVSVSQATTIMGEAADAYNTAKILNTNAGNGFGQADWHFDDICLTSLKPSYETEGCDLFGSDDCECLVCAECGNPEGGCTCVFCSSCGELMQNCTCETCVYCGELSDECVCEMCEVCGYRASECICYPDP
jgi:hypothetical protein